MTFDGKDKNGYAQWVLACREVAIKVTFHADQYHQSAIGFRDVSGGLGQMMQMITVGTWNYKTDSGICWDGE
jgi:hypothetical protein